MKNIELEKKRNSMRTVERLKAYATRLKELQLKKRQNDK